MLLNDKGMHDGLVEEVGVRYLNCRARSFLLNKRGVDYHALFNDPASDETIDPTSGYPRPEPDLAIRTKGYALPPEVYDDYPQRKIASRFSGLMRLAVGCYHATGRNAPFTYGWEKTHGIVKFTEDSVDKYWVVEISQQGVFAARVKVGSECCGSWNVTQYLTSPALELSLHSRWQNFDQQNIQRVLRPEQVIGMYAYGQPWCTDHGWAFSASGRLAQNAVYDTSISPVDCYVGARVLITFGNAGGNRLTASTTVVEENKKFTLARGRTIWVPLGGGQWQGTEGPTGNEDPNPFELLGAQDAPVHVYYDGETEKVTRWTLAWSEQPAQNQTAVFSTATGNNSQDTCYGVVNVPNPISGQRDGIGLPAYELLNTGFTGPGFSYSGDSYVYTGFTQTWRQTNQRESVTEYSATNNMEVDCYFYYEDPDTHIVSLITSCGFTAQLTLSIVDSWTYQVNGTWTASVRPSVVLFMEEREAVMVVGISSVRTLGIEQSSNLTGQVLHHDQVTISTLLDGACPPQDYSLESSGNTAPEMANFSGPVDSYEDSAQATLTIGGISHVLPLGCTGGEIDNANFSTFVRHGPTHETAASAAFAMHGNYAPTGSEAYYLAAMNVSGGYSYTSGEVVAFIGKV